MRERFKTLLFWNKVFSIIVWCSKAVSSADSINPAKPRWPARSANCDAVTSAADDAFSKRRKKKLLKRKNGFMNCEIGLHFLKKRITWKRTVSGLRRSDFCNTDRCRSDRCSGSRFVSRKKYQHCQSRLFPASLAFKEGNTTPLTPVSSGLSRISRFKSHSAT